MKGHRQLPASPDAFQALVRAFLERGYAIRDFHQVEPDRPHLVLRHDVDFSLAEAVAIAEAEHELAVGATFFVQMRSEFYNPAAPASLGSLKRIIALGHEIGLHFDASIGPRDGDGIDRAARAECDALEHVTEAPVRIVSFHKPARSLLGQATRIGGRRHTYEPAYFTEIGYCSDSRGEWRFGHPLDHEAVAAGGALQLLTHPVWWVGAGSLQERLERFLDRRATTMDRELAENCSVHQSRKDVRHEHEG